MKNLLLILVVIPVFCFAQDEAKEKSTWINPMIGKTVAGITMIDKDELINMRYLNLAPPVEVGLKVTGFKLSTSQGGHMVEHRSNSNKVTADMSKMLADALPGNQYYFEKITVANKDGKAVELRNDSFRVQVK